MEPMQRVKMGWVDYISRQPNQKPKKVSAYDEEFTVAKSKLKSASVNSLKLQSSQSALLLQILIQAHDLASQITLKYEPKTKAFILISTCQ